MYKASRRREYERLRLMQSEVDREKNDESWEKEREEARRKDEEKTEKNRRRREKRKNVKGKKGGAAQKDAAPAVTGLAAPNMDNGADGLKGAEGAVSQEVPGVIIHDDD